MYLLVAATALEMEPLRSRLGEAEDVDFLITGPGPVETTFSLTRYLQAPRKAVEAVLDFGVAGAYPDTGVALLDLCLAEKEVFGDSGICAADTIRDFEGAVMSAPQEFDLRISLLAQVQEIISLEALPCKTGTFVTVNCVSGSEKRGVFLRDKHGALCENMEGAAVARVCNGFGLPVVELRCVSNYVEDRDVAAWRLEEACIKCADAVCTIVQRLRADRGFRG